MGTLLCGSRLNALANGRRIGEIGIRLFEEKYYDPSLLCAYYVSYYGYIAPLFENLQGVVSKLKRAMDVGLRMGFVSNVSVLDYACLSSTLPNSSSALKRKIETIQEALMAGQHYIQKSFFAGTSLTTILAENEKLIKLAAKYKNPQAERYSRQVSLLLLQGNV